jgi:hypothetical protein
MAVGPACESVRIARFRLSLCCIAGVTVNPRSLTLVDEPDLRSALGVAALSGVAVDLQRLF